MQKKIDVPVALFIFKRTASVLLILKVLEKIKPSKLYLISDHGRNDLERKLVLDARKIIENAVTWECEIFKRYQINNVGVYENIAGGAKWVFEHEDSAIFLEDDNLPEITFFQYCSELLTKYKENDKVLWICGSNYLEECSPEDGASYVFSCNMLPCGWASWKDKFNRYYDGDLSLYAEIDKKTLRNKYKNKKLFGQDMYNVEYELDYKDMHGHFYSWDYQMAFSMRFHEVYSIVPKFNQIRNIGVDDKSIHGGNSLNDIMVERFCERKTKQLDFPLIHPTELAIDNAIEEALANVIVDPRFFSLKSIISRLIRRAFCINKTISIKDAFIK
ncbi:hemolytic protein HlpA [Shewanella baltica]|uniref:hemolytic protein HlpA n=1 Tax=Shewanella baltica TaxID=62322 RepID=UPI000D1ADDBD|nr:hemolytic protein HlpA [Shewanella baltica]AVT50208.1 hemolytic protein HlpA [Shewanella baltica]